MPYAASVAGRSGSWIAVLGALAALAAVSAGAISLAVDGGMESRIDPADILQEAYLEASARLGEYLRDPRMPFFLWLRFLVGQKLLTLHRHHLGTRMRDVSLEVPLAGGVPGVSSTALAERLVSLDTSPSEAVGRAELERKVQEALDSMDDIDREVLVLRHFEHLTRTEAAQALDISEAACAKRYLRALKRLREVLGHLLEPRPAD